MSGKNNEEWARKFLEQGHLPAGETSHTPCSDCIAIVAAIRKQERERCAEVCSSICAEYHYKQDPFIVTGANKCENAIRALEEEDNA
jgi:hypothetical protein